MECGGGGGGDGVYYVIVAPINYWLCPLNPPCDEICPSNNLRTPNMPTL